MNIESCGTVRKSYLQKRLQPVSEAFRNGLYLTDTFNRGERIRTSGLLVPNQALYQAEPRPEWSPNILTQQNRFHFDHSRPSSQSVKRSTCACAVRSRCSGDTETYPAPTATKSVISV